MLALVQAQLPGNFVMITIAIITLTIKCYVMISIVTDSIVKIQR